MTGRSALRANAPNSLRMHVRAMTASALAVVPGAPGVPNIDGIATVMPRSTQASANATTSGVMPGISAITTTPGPLPRQYTS